jgi:hypothetical protein
MRRHAAEDTAQEDEVADDEKTVERENSRNCQQVYSSSPVKLAEKMQDNVSGN